MEIREHLSVYLESGYLFDDMSGKLKWFEIDKILISFTYGVVRYVGTWGGCRAEKTLDGKLFYSSEECFKKDKSIPKTKLSIYDVFKSLYGFAPIGDVCALKTSEEPKAKICLKQFFGIEIEPKYKFKPFDKVLVRDTEDDDWHVSLFVRKIADAQYKEERYECLNGTGWIYCIPYEGNEHLL